MIIRLFGKRFSLIVFLLAVLFTNLVNAQSGAAWFSQQLPVSWNNFKPGSDLFRLDSDSESMVYLPSIYNDYHSPGLYGYVTNQGIPVQGIHIVLSYNDGSGSGWQDYDLQITNSDGYYIFPNIPTLQPGKYYGIEYRNGQDGNLKNTLFFNNWWKFISGYDGGYQLGDSFDLAAPVLLSPFSGSSLTLPITFTWTSRPWSPSDYYLFYMEDIDPAGPVYVSPANIYGTQYMLTDLPQYFTYNYTYRWHVAVFNENGGVGFMVKENMNLITLLP